MKINDLHSKFKFNSLKVNLEGLELYFSSVNGIFLFPFVMSDVIVSTVWTRRVYFIRPYYFRMKIENENQ